MRRRIVAAVVVVLGLGTAARADGWLSQMWHSVKTDWRRNNAWPEPFNHIDREAATAVFGVQIAKGIQVQNTLGAQHFDPDTGELTEGGRLKVEYILTRAPVPQRAIFVERGLSAEETASRMAMVRGYAWRILPRGASLEIYETTLPPRQTPADAVVAEQAGFASSMPPPRLAAPTSATGE